MEYVHGPQGSVLRGKYCHVPFWRSTILAITSRSFPSVPSCPRPSRPVPSSLVPSALVPSRPFGSLPYSYRSSRTNLSFGGLARTDNHGTSGTHQQEHSDGSIRLRTQYHHQLTTDALSPCPHSCYGRFTIFIITKTSSVLARPPYV